jgi:hypothetical protein
MSQDVARLVEAAAFAQQAEADEDLLGMLVADLRQQHLVWAFSSTQKSPSPFSSFCRVSSGATWFMRT